MSWGLTSTFELASIDRLTWNFWQRWFQRDRRQKWFAGMSVMLCRTASMSKVPKLLPLKIYLPLQDSDWLLAFWKRLFYLNVVKTQSIHAYFFKNRNVTLTFYFWTPSSAKILKQNGLPKMVLETFVETWSKNALPTAVIDARDSKHSQFDRVWLFKENHWW